MNTKKDFIIFGAFALVVLGLAFLGPVLHLMKHNKETTKQLLPYEDPITGLKIIEWKTITKYEDVGWVVGRLKNTSKDKYDYVELKIKIIDGNDDLVDSDRYTNICNLNPGETWKFSIPVLSAVPDKNWSCREPVFKVSKYK